MRAAATIRIRALPSVGGSQASLQPVETIADCTTVGRPIGRKQRSDRRKDTGGLLFAYRNGFGAVNTIFAVTLSDVKLVHRAWTESLPPSIAEPRPAEGPIDTIFQVRALHIHALRRPLPARHPTRRRSACTCSCSCAARICTAREPPYRESTPHVTHCMRPRIKLPPTSRIRRGPVSPIAAAMRRVAGGVVP